MGNRDWNKNNLICVASVLIASMLVLTGCKSSAQMGTGNVRKPEEAPINVGSSDDYSDYINDSIKSVTNNTTPTPEPKVEDTQSVDVILDDLPDKSLYVSSSDSLKEDSGVTPDFSVPEEPVEEENGESDEETEEAEGEAESNVTPDEFEVGKCCIYINGAIDDQYGADIITALNKARTDLGYTPLTEKNGLDVCANRRTREIATFLSHKRPDGTPFYSLAPMYFKAEMLAIDGAKPEETVEAWIRDPYSRNLVFTEKFTSVGAACFKCNTLNCVVVALGY